MAFLQQGFFWSRDLKQYISLPIGFKKKDVALLWMKKRRLPQEVPPIIFIIYFYLSYLQKND